MAKLLDKDEIPVQIVVRHEKWQDIRTAIVESDRPTATAMEYDIERDHPDLGPVLGAQ